QICWRKREGDWALAGARSWQGSRRGKKRWGTHMLEQCGHRANFAARHLAARQRLALGAFLATIAAAVWAVVDVPTSLAADYNGIFVTDGGSVKRVVVTIHKSRTFNFQRSFVRAIPGAADIADVLPLSDRSIYVQGKKVGTTNVSLIDAEGRLL